MSVNHEAEDRETAEIKSPEYTMNEAAAEEGQECPEDICEPGEGSEPVELTVEQLQELVNRLAGELEDSRNRAEGYYRRLLRMEADFESFRRRTRAEKAELELYAGEKVIAGLLPVLDNLERALEAVKQTRDLDSLIQGLDLVYRGFKETLDREGLKVIEALGQDFDPELHEALAQVPAEETGKPDNIVVQEFQKGYLLKGKVIRPARVAVAKEQPNGTAAGDNADS